MGWSTARCAPSSAVAARRRANSCSPRSPEPGACDAGSKADEGPLTREPSGYEVARTASPQPCSVIAAHGPVRCCRFNARERAMERGIRERLEAELAHATAELKAFMATWEYAF